MAVDFKALNKFDQGALIAGALAFVLSFFERYVSASIGSFTVGANAWHSYATLGVLLVIVSTAVVAAKAFAKESLPAEVPWNLVAVATAGVGTVLIVLRALTVSGASVGWSGWLLFVATIALTAFTALAFKESGEKLPDLNKGNDAPPAA